MGDPEKRWRCTLCGYVHLGATPPDMCPVCGASPSEFEPYEEPEANTTQPTARRWRCLNCNYVHEGDRPADLCAVCGAGPDRFEPMAEADAEGNIPSHAIRAVIIGGGIAGVSAAESIRNASSDSSITLITNESRLPYYRLNLTRYLASEIDAASLPIHPETWYGENRIELLTGRHIVELSAEEQSITLNDDSTVEYDKLILATGSHPFVPPITGIELGGVFTLRTTADADAIIERFEAGAACVCIGGGILGMEVAGALAKRGGDVTMLESGDRLMPRQLNTEAATVLESHMVSSGIRVRKGARTTELRGIGGMVSEVVLRDGAVIPCGMVVICTGVRPNTSLARKSGLDVDRGIVVDNYLTTSIANILAAGDAAEHNGIVYGVWGPSQYQGAMAGLNALGIKTSFGGVPRSSALKVLDIEMLSIGEFLPEDGSYRVVQELSNGIFRHFVFHDGRLVGCILLGDARPAAQVKQAIEGRKDFSKLLSGTPDCTDILQRL